MPMIAAVSPKQVGTRSRLPGTMVRWPPYTMGTCAKSTERRQSGLLCEGSRARRSISFKAACTPLRRVLAKYAAYHNDVRTHVSLGKDAPCTRQIEPFG